MQTLHPHPMENILLWFIILEKGTILEYLNISKGYLNIISNGKLDEAPSFAPNSAMILYAAKMKNKGVLYATSIDGRIKKRIELNSMDVREPVWSN